MRIKVPLSYLKKVDKSLVPEGFSAWARDSDPHVELENAENLPAATVAKLKALSRADLVAKKYPGVHFVDDLLRRVVAFQSQPDAALVKVPDLDTLLASLTEAVRQTSPKRHWLFRRMSDGAVCPVYVASMSKRRRYGDEPSRVELTLCWSRAGGVQKRVLWFYRSDLSSLLRDDEPDSGREPETADSLDPLLALEGAIACEGEDDEEDDSPKRKKAAPKGARRTLAEVLAGKKLCLETPELVEAYRASAARFSKFQGQCGKPVTAAGRAFYLASFKSWRDETEYSAEVRETDTDGVPAELVLDDTNLEKLAVERSWRYDIGFEDEDDEQVELPNFWGKPSYSVPFHPYVLAFDLKRHQHLYVHADRLSERSYDKSMLGKLAIPQRDKAFLSSMMKLAGLKMDDIVSGKSGGVFILSVGPPGTGKTLTAEVYSESIGRPLYSVQCQQLGIKPEQIEERLVKILKRAERWRAILLLDEADVYARARGMDLVHNAVVGVMLRVIEYYSGVLFMTTNMADIDDAILSRATAHLRYRRPGPALLPEMWRVLSKQLGLELSEKAVRELAAEWPGAVGRDVKNLVKLARMHCEATGEKPSADAVRLVSEYQDVAGLALGEEPK